MKVVFCCPTVTRPYEQFLEAMKAELPLLDAAGLDHKMVWEIGNPYISSARAIMLRKALDEQPDAIVFLDHDLSWKPGDLLRLIQTEGPVIAGTYRFKRDEEEYMGTIRAAADGKPIVRDDGCVRAEWVPAGFLKVTSQAVHDFMASYPELMFGSRYRPHIDLFNHGAHEWIWYGEDYSFSRRWNERGGEIWVIPDLDLTHHGSDRPFPGNYHRYLLRQPGGSHHPQLKEVA